MHEHPEVPGFTGRPPLPALAWVVLGIDGFIGLWGLYDTVQDLPAGFFSANFTAVLLLGVVLMAFKRGAGRVLLRIMHAMAIAMLLLLAIILLPISLLRVRTDLPMFGVVVLSSVILVALGWFAWGFWLLGREDVRRACGWPRR
ncbi:MAG: hypothetical protein AAFV77_04380 [Planctomycetota bacterium]